MNKPTTGLSAAINDCATANFKSTRGTLAPCAATTDATQATDVERDRRVGASQWDDEVYYPRGLVGEVARYFASVAGCYQPKFALAAALVTCGALLGRGVRDYTGQRTNIFALAVGFTSAGKDALIKFIQKLVRALGRDNRLLAGEMRSDAALERTLEAFPVRLMLLDEIGHYFGTLKKSVGNSPFLASVIPMLTKLWSAADRDHELATRATPQESGAGGKKWQPPKALHQPCVCVYGTSAPRVLFENLDERDLDDGSLPRYVPFISRDRAPFIPKSDEPVPDELVRRLDERLKALGLFRSMYGGDDSTIQNVQVTDLPAEAATIPETPDARLAFEELEKLKLEKLKRGDEGDPYLMLYGKLVENARRIALTIASFQDGDGGHPQVDGYAAHYACKLVKLAVGEMVAACRRNLRKTKAEAAKQKLLDIIRRAGGNGITGSVLGRKTQDMTPRDRRDYLEDLEENEQITHREDRSDQCLKPKRTYFYTDTEDADS